METPSVTIWLAIIAMISLGSNGYLLYLTHRDKLRYDVDMALLRSENVQLKERLNEQRKSTGSPAELA